MYKIFTSLVFCSMFLLATSQELNCEVSVVVANANKTSADNKVKTDANVFKTLENSIYEFMNNTKWTSEVFEVNEKIDCNILIVINSQLSENKYTGTISVSSTRPVFNSGYKTNVLNLIDKDFLIDYKEFEPIELAENQFTTNLSHILAFYANIIIGVDYETFSERGGEKYLLKAQDMTNTISFTDAKTYTGWKSTDKNKRNRYWLITNMLNTRYENYRKALYTYYRLGLDNFYSDEKLARKNLLDGLKLLSKVSADNPNLNILQMWSETKAKETIKIFKDAPTEEKNEAVQVLKKVDPVNSNDYNAILK